VIEALVNSAEYAGAYGWYVDGEQKANTTEVFQVSNE
jgi:hypothetical protein